MLTFLASALLLDGCVFQQRSQLTHDTIGKISESKLRQHVQALTKSGSRSANNIDGTRRTVNYLASELSRSGYQVIEEPVKSDSSLQNSRYTFVNVIAELPGSGQQAQILEIGAHYDTVEQSPGADDNASGVSAMLEIARTLSAIPLQRSIRFCFFAQEERGGYGSRYHVRQIVSKQEAVAGAIILEMIGYTSQDADSQASPLRIPFLFSPPTTGNFIAVIGNLASGKLGNRIEAASRHYVADLEYFSANRVGGFFKDALRSDHKYYWDAGIRAIMLTDTANLRNPNYHRTTDTADTLDYTFLRQVTQAVAATALDWAEAVE